MESLFADIKDAPVSLGGVWFKPGTYTIEVNRVFTIRSRKGENLFIVECNILKSDCEECKIGTTASWVVNFKQDAALGNIKAFLAAANGLDPGNEAEVKNQITTEVADLAVSSENPLHGTRMALQVVNIKTKAGNDFSKHFWSPIEETA